jgi:uncharacterized membrane protein YczE
LINLYVGLIAYGISMALMVESHLGNMPWDVFHQGIARTTGLSMGAVTIIVGAFVLLLWIPLRQRPGLGTLSNVVVIGLAVDTALYLVPTPSALWLRLSFLVAGVLVCAVATGLYVGARLGPGPRDGLMTGLAARGYSIRLVRTGIEVSVVLIGFLLGGTLGIGTIIYALTIGPLVHITLPLLAVRVPHPVPATEPARSDSPEGDQLGVPGRAGAQELTNWAYGPGQRTA